MLTEPTASRTYAYDEENRLTSGERSFAGGALVRLVAVGYDALGRRVKSTDSIIDGLEGSVTVTRHVYSGLAVVEEYTVSGGTATLAREFVWGASFPLTRGDWPGQSQSQRDRPASPAENRRHKLVV